MNIDLQSLGITQEDLIARVVDKISQNLLSGYYDDELGDTVSGEIERRVKAAAQDAIDAAVNRIADKHFENGIAEYVESLTLQATNRWGEKQGGPITFTEYLVRRADEYMTEKVDYDGKSRDKNSYNWTGTQTRLTHLINSHLHFHITEAMKKVVNDANGILMKGLEETVKVKLNEIAEKLKVQVKA